MLVNEDSVSEVLNRISKYDRIAIDLETTGLSPFKNDYLVGAAIGLDLDSYYLPFRHGEGHNLPASCLENLLVVIKDKVWTTYNGKFDLKFLRKEMFRFGMNYYPPVCEDVMLASHLLDENQPNFKLKDTGDRYAKFLGLGENEASAEQSKLDEYLMDHHLGHGQMWRVPAQIVAPYAEMDVILTQKLRALFVPALERWKLYGIWQELNDYLSVIAKMEERGMKLDRERIMSNISQAETNAVLEMERLRKESGIPTLNPNSAKFFKSYINTELMINAGTSIVSTEVDVLESVLDILPEDGSLYKTIDASIKYRRWVKVNSTYYQAFLYHQLKDILHPNLHMTGTVTGRFSCSEPNLQAIPRKEKEDIPKNHVKEVFIARPGMWLVQIDYKMAEIYLGSHLAGAKNMIAMIKEGRDVHAETARLMNDIPRSIGKRLNFAVMYGIGAKSFMEDVWKMAGLRITYKQAENYIAQYQAVHPEMKRMYHDLEYEARTEGFVRMVTGRVRRYNGSERFSADGYKPSPYQKASSNVVQGSVAEIMRLASTKISHEIGHKAHQLLHVHDSILFEVAENDFDTIQEIERIMCIEEVNGEKLSVPMKVDIEVGTRWSDLTPIKEFARPWKE